MMSKKIFTNPYRPDTMVVQCMMARADMIMVSKASDSEIEFSYRTTVYNEKTEKEEMAFGTVVMDAATFSTFVAHLRALDAAISGTDDDDPWNADDGEAHPFYNTDGIIDKDDN